MKTYDTQAKRLQRLLQIGSIRAATKEEIVKYREYFPKSSNTVYIFEPFDTGTHQVMHQAVKNVFDFIDNALFVNSK